MSETLKVMIQAACLNTNSLIKIFCRNDLIRCFKPHQVSFSYSYCFDHCYLT